MKRTLTGIVFLTAMLYAQGGTQPTTDDFNITMDPMWKDLEQNAKHAIKFGGRWILAGMITFKKKAQDKVHLERLYLQWHGPKIDNLIASLYTSDCAEDFLPIQENLICDGTWNNAQQRLLFNFDEKQSLTFKNCYFLVLTVPEALEPVLKSGQFSLVTTILPEPLQECLQNKQLCLQYNKPPQVLFKNQVQVAKR